MTLTKTLVFWKGRTSILAAAVAVTVSISSLS